MIRRAPRVLIAMALTLLVSGCAVGRFIVGAPASRPEPPARKAQAPARADDLLARRCSGCHAIPDPARMSAAEWRAAVGRMKGVMTLPDHEWATLETMAAGAPGAAEQR